MIIHGIRQFSFLALLFELAHSILSPQNAVVICFCAVVVSFYFFSTMRTHKFPASQYWPEREREQVCVCVDAGRGNWILLMLRILPKLLSIR